MFLSDRANGRVKVRIFQCSFASKQIKKQFQRKYNE